MAGAPNSAMVGKIDRLISLYALKALSAAERDAMAELYAKEPEGVKNILVYMKALNREEDLKVISEEARLNGFKGHLPDHGKAGSKLIIADDRKKSELERKGYVRVADATADEGFSSVARGYYKTNTKQTGAYSQGIMQAVQNTYRGVDAESGLTTNGTTSGVISGADVTTITDELNRLGTVNDVMETLLPVYDDTGVAYYERYMNPILQQAHTEPESNLALMLGAWAGRQVEEKFAQQFNNEMVVELKRVYDARMNDEDGLYINLIAEAGAMERYNNATPAQQKTMKKPDPIYADTWRVIPSNTKEQIEAVFGPGTFMVRRDQMNLALGYRDPSVIDLWTGDTRVPEVIQQGVVAVAERFMGKHAMKAMAATEGAIQAGVSTAKDIIVVRSLIVPYMNTQANVFQLATRGVPIKQTVKRYPEVFAEIEQYNKNVKELIKLDMRVQMAGTNQNRLDVLAQERQVILDQNARMKIATLINACAYKNISEGLSKMDVELSSGRFGDWISQQTDKLPKGLQTVAKYGLLSKDTVLYQGANKAVQYGDFIAKQIFFEHLIAKGVDTKKALALTNQEFVNFSVLPGRTRQYTEGMGLSWFLTFKLRIAKIAMNQVREHPLRALLTIGLVPDSPLTDNFVTAQAQGRLEYSLGPEMLFESPGLNPWANVMGW